MSLARRASSSLRTTDGATPAAGMRDEPGLDDRLSVASDAGSADRSIRPSSRFTGMEIAGSLDAWGKSLTSPNAWVRLVRSQPPAPRAAHCGNNERRDPVLVSHQ